MVGEDSPHPDGIGHVPNHRHATLEAFDGGRGDAVAVNVAAVTYRQELAVLDRLATPAPWHSDGSLYGLSREGSFRALGFAPHRVRDAELVAVYRSALGECVAVIDAVERLARRGADRPRLSLAASIAQVLGLFDCSNGTAEGARRHLDELDRSTTAPLWDPGHLVMGMELSVELTSTDIVRPSVADPALIAAARSAVPRALALFAAVQGTFADPGDQGALAGSRSTAVLELIEQFDGHSASEGAGTGTV